MLARVVRVCARYPWPVHCAGFKRNEAAWARQTGEHTAFFGAEPPPRRATSKAAASKAAARKAAGSGEAE